MNNEHNKGSIWRIWDLHVHSPATYRGEYQTFIDNWEMFIMGIVFSFLFNKECR